MNPLIDVQYIHSFKDGKSNKDAKRELREYAKKTFGVILNGQKSFDNMIKQLIDLVPNDFEPTEDVGAFGHTIDDIITAFDTLEGIESNNQKEPDASLVAKIEKTGKNNEVLVVDSPEVVESELKVSNTTPRTDNANTVIRGSGVDTSSAEKDKTEDIKAMEEVKLPYDFVPAFSLLGAKPGYYTIPGWIYDWLVKNPDWKTKTHALGPQYTRQLNSYLYYIKKNGSLLVKESIRSTFKILK